MAPSCSFSLGTMSWAKIVERGFNAEATPGSLKCLHMRLTDPFQPQLTTSMTAYRPTLPSRTSKASSHCGHLHGNSLAPLRFSQYAGPRDPKDSLCIVGLHGGVLNKNNWSIPVRDIIPRPSRSEALYFDILDRTKLDRGENRRHHVGQEVQRSTMSN